MRRVNIARFFLPAGDAIKDQDVSNLSREGFESGVYAIFDSAYYLLLSGIVLFGRPKFAKKFISQFIDEAVQLLTGQFQGYVFGSFFHDIAS